MAAKISETMALDNRILRTKLHPPPVRPHTISREHLNAKLAERQFRLGVVSAPAGFGKSTYIRHWVDTLNTEYTWLSLDERDNSLPKFIRYIVAALRELDDSIGSQTLEILQSDSLPPIETVLTPFINDLYDLPKEGLLILDDYHVINDTEIHDTLRFLTEQIPPQIRLVLISRVDPAFPVAKYRARGELMEIREEDLRFTEEEAKRFLNGEMKLGLTEDNLKTLNEKTEGWAAGIQLASLSLQQSKDKDVFLKSFSGETGYVLDYLMEEVFAGLSDNVQNFLLRTSILNQFNAGLASAVSSVEDTAKILNRLEEQNLFLVPLDEQGEWFRYHHLFGELLQFRLKQHFPDEIGELCRRASDWYQSNGHIEQALEYAFRMADKSKAFALLDRNTEHLISQSRLTEFRRWIEKIPEDVIPGYPMILLGRGWMHLLSHRRTDIGQDIDTIRQLVESDECGYSEERKRYVQFLTKILQAFWYRVNGDIQRAIILSERTLEAMPAEHSIMHGLLRYNLARAYIKLGYVQKPIALLEQVIGESSSKTNYYLLLSSKGHLCTQLIQSGGPAAATHRVQKYLTDLEARGLHHLPAACYLYSALGYAEYLRNNIDTATEALENAVRLARQGDDPYVQYQSLLILAMCEIARDDSTRAHTHFSEAAQIYHESQVGIFGSDIETDELYLDLLAGDFSHVGAGLTQLGVEPGADFSVIRERQGFIAIRYAIHTKDSKRAREYIAWLRPYVEDFQRDQSQLLLEIYGMLAAFLSEDKKQTFDTIAAVLQAAADREEIRLFLNIGEPIITLLKEYISWEDTQNPATEFARMLLNELQHQSGTQTIPKFRQDLIEPLTEREQEVLSYLIENKTYQEIANSMFVSVNTIKTHLKNLYAKLGVGSKSEAVEKAKSMGFLDD